MCLKNLLRGCATALVLSLSFGCIRDNVDENARINEESSSRTLESLITRSATYYEAESSIIMSQQQADHDNFMMGRIIYKNDRYELCLKREDANFFGVSNEMYDEYVAYVERLNALAMQ